MIFLTNGVALSTSGLSAGSATTTNNTLPRGTNTITVEYAGDGNYTGSTNWLAGGQVVTNHPPVASVMTVTCTAGSNLLIALSDVATNWNDVDGDLVSLTGINLTTTNGVTLFPINLTTNLDGSYVITNTAYLGYDDSNNLNDQISYSISDNQGGTDIGHISVAVSIWQTAVISGSQQGANGYSFSFTAAPGQPYAILISTNLTLPMPDWITNSTGTVGASGVTGFTNATPTNIVQFYRVRSP